MPDSRRSSADHASRLRIPSEENGQAAIVSAEVETDKGIYSGIGDASPANVSRAMLTCTIRLAETRAKARALRDAVNVGVAELEELGDVDQAETVESRPAVTSASATPAQRQAIARLAGQLGKPVDVDGLTKSAA